MMNQDNFALNPLLDQEQLQMLKEAGLSEDTDLFREILELYEEESSVKLKELTQFSVSGDFDSLGKSAHALAGSSANIGGREVWRLSKTIEDLCKSGRGGQSLELIPEVERVYAQTLEAFKVMLNKREA